MLKRLKKRKERTKLKRGYRYKVKDNLLQQIFEQEASYFAKTERGFTPSQGEDNES